MFEPLNDLERLLMAAATDPAQRPAFSKAVLEGELFVSPLSEPDADGKVAGLRSMTLGEGEIAVAMFTAPERGIAAFGPDILFLTNDGRALLEWLRPGPVMLNPGQDYGVVWRSDDLEVLLDGMKTEVVAQDTKILLGHPAERPEDLIARLTGALSSSAGVREAYLMLAFRVGQVEPTWLLGVANEGDWRSVQALIGEAVDGYAFDRPLDVIRLEGSDLAATLRTGIPIVANRDKPIAAAPRKRGFFKFFGKD